MTVVDSREDDNRRLCENQQPDTLAEKRMRMEQL